MLRKIYFTLLSMALMTQSVNANTPHHTATMHQSTYNVMEKLAMTSTDNTRPYTTREDFVPYPISKDVNALITYSKKRSTRAFSIGTGNNVQTITVNQKESKKFYFSNLDHYFTAQPGQTINSTIDYEYTDNNMPWMHSYIYIDKGKDGRFDVGSNVKRDLTDDLMSFSYFQGYDSNENVISQNGGDPSGYGNRISPPHFTIPSSMTPGYYRMRIKVDWDNVNPAGSSEILEDDGIIIDTRINIHNENVNISIANDNQHAHGEILSIDNRPLTSGTTPFKQDFTFKVKPHSGYGISHVTIRHGYGLDGEKYIFDTQQYEEYTIPGHLLVNNTYTIPAEKIDGDIKIIPFFQEVSSKGDYPVNFNKDELTTTRTDRKLNSFTIKGPKSGNRTITVSGNNKVYQDLTTQQASATPGETMNVDLNYTGGFMHVYLYVDYNNDGQFDNTLNANGTPGGQKELVSYSYYQELNSLGQIVHWDTPVPMSPIPAFTIPANLPKGKYRARLKVDWDNIDPAGKYVVNQHNNINDIGGTIVDFLLNIHDAEHRVMINTTHGSITGAPYKTSLFQPFTIRTVPTAPGYNITKLVIKHGHNFDGPQFIRGNRQWEEISVNNIGDNTGFQIPENMVDGDMIITGEFTDNGSAYKLVFSDEFNDADDSYPNANYWHSSPRGSSAWNRFIADDNRVRFIHDGNFVAKAVPINTNAMLTGSIETSGKFSFQYGRIEARILTNKHTGNFPAFWLLPENPKEEWPKEGEIDIWEQINNEDISYHAIHTNWTWNLAKGGNNASKNVPMDRFHTYTLDWSPTQLIWYIDGEQTFVYDKSKNSSELEQGQWPFDRPFYIILSQSVGNGGWAANPDYTHSYETRFDWVRVYQKDIPTMENITLRTTPGEMKEGGLRISDEEIYTHFKNFSSQYAIQLPQDSKLTVFIATQIDREGVTLKKVNNNTIPANTGVILAYRGGKTKNDIPLTAYRIFGPYSEEYLNSINAGYENNLLVAIVTNTTLPLENRRHFGHYLNEGESLYSIGFYTPTDLYRTLSAGTCYLKDESVYTTEFLPILIDNSLKVSVDEVEKEDNDSWYNLQGIKQASPTTPGIYIKNGKKVVVGRQ